MSVRPIQNSTPLDIRAMLRRVMPVRGVLDSALRRIVLRGARLVDGPGRRLVALDEDRLLAAARRRAGGRDFGDTTFLGGLRQLLRGLVEEAGLNFLGRIAAREAIVNCLANRLRLERDRGRHPEIGTQEIRRPLVITGLPRSGSTLLHALLAQDPANRVPQTWEMMTPSPPPETATYDGDPRIAITARQIRWFPRLAPEFRKIHAVGARLPEECVVILSHSFLSTRSEEHTSELQSLRHLV